MIEKILIAGAGGQGVMLLGKVLATAAMKEGRFVTCLPAYGAEVRGGTAHCMVVISDKEIGSPYVEKADTLIIMNNPSLQKFKSRIKKGGLFILNSSLTDNYSDRNNLVLQYPLTDIAIEMGNIKVANMVALGVFAAYKKIVSLKNLSAAIAEVAPSAKKGLIGVNKIALEKGAGLKMKGEK